MQQTLKRKHFFYPQNPVLTKCSQKDERKNIQFPYVLAAHPRLGTIEKNHMQSSSDLFRAALFLCSESDTSLKNYTTKTPENIDWYMKNAGLFHEGLHKTSSHPCSFQSVSLGLSLKKGAEYPLFHLLH